MLLSASVGSSDGLCGKPLIDLTGTKAIARVTCLQKQAACDSCLAHLSLPKHVFHRY